MGRSKVAIVTCYVVSFFVEFAFVGSLDAAYDAMIAEASSITDDARRTECYRAAEKILSDEAANVYLQDMADFVAIRSTLDGYQFYPLYVMDLSTVGYK